MSEFLTGRVTELENQIKSLMALVFPGDGSDATNLPLQIRCLIENYASLIKMLTPLQEQCQNIHSLLSQHNLNYAILSQDMQTMKEELAKVDLGGGGAIEVLHNRCNGLEALLKSQQDAIDGFSKRLATLEDIHHNQLASREMLEKAGQQVDLDLPPEFQQDTTRGECSVHPSLPAVGSKWLCCLTKGSPEFLIIVKRNDGFYIDVEEQPTAQNPAPYMRVFSFNTLSSFYKHCYPYREAMPAKPSGVAESMSKAHQLSAAVGMVGENSWDSKVADPINHPNILSSEPVYAQRGRAHPFDPAYEGSVSPHGYWSHAMAMTGDSVEGKSFPNRWGTWGEDLAEDNKRLFLTLDEASKECSKLRTELARYQKIGKLEVQVGIAYPVEGGIGTALVHGTAEACAQIEKMVEDNARLHQTNEAYSARFTEMCKKEREQKDENVRLRQQNATLTTNIESLANQKVKLLGDLRQAGEFLQTEIDERARLNLLVTELTNQVEELKRRGVLPLDGGMNSENAEWSLYKKMWLELGRQNHNSVVQDRMWEIEEKFLSSSQEKSVPQGNDD